MLPLFAFRTKEHKLRNKESQRKAVRKAMILNNPMKPIRNNTCDNAECGHYLTTHNEEGCQSTVYDNQKMEFKKCPCQVTNKKT